MKTLKIGPKFGLRPEEVIYAFGSEKLFQECVSARWLVPIIQRHKLTLYDHGNVAKCWARILAGDVPNEVRAAAAAEVTPKVTKHLLIGGHEL